MFILAKRNIKLYFRDHSAVFFSLLASLITLALYAFFLGDMMKKSLENSTIPNANLFVQTWTMAGILGVTGFTTTLGAFATMVEDKTLKIDKDFLSSPLKSSQIVSGYILSSYLVGVIMTVIVFILSQIYLLTLGSEMLTLLQIAQILGVLLLTNLMNTAIISFVILFVKTMSAFSGLGTLTGTLIGFLTGIYIPIGELPTFIQGIIKCFPVSQAAVLYRKILLADVMETSFANAPSNVIVEIKEQLGIIFNINGITLTPMGHILIIVGFLLLFYVLTLICLKQFTKKN